MLDETLALLSAEEVAILTGQDVALLKPSENVLPEAWLTLFLHKLVGERTYVKEIEKALDSNNSTRVFALASHAAEIGEALPNQINRRVDAMWETAQDHLRTQLAVTKKRLEELPVTFENETVQAMREECAQALEDCLKALTSRSSFRRTDFSKKSSELLFVTRTLETLLGDTEVLGELVKEDKEETISSIRTQGLAAFSSLIERLSNEEFRDGVADAELLRALPDLVLGRRVETLAEIAEGKSPNLSGISTSRSEGSIHQSLPVTSLRLRRDVQDAKELSVPGLSAMSQLVYVEAKEKDGGSELKTLEDVVNLERILSSRSTLKDQGKRWFASAQVTSDRGFKAVAMANGLLAHGWQALHEQSPLPAAVMLQDALKQLSQAPEKGCEKTFENCTRALIIVKAWPELVSISRKRNQSVSSVLANWSQDPGSLMAWLTENARMDIPAEVWAQCPDSIQATRILTSLRTITTSDPALLEACGESLLSLKELTLNPSNVLQKVVNLFELFDGVEEEIFTNVEDIAELLARAPDGQPGRLKAKILDGIADLRTLLGGSSLGSTALRDFIGSLPNQLERVVQSEDVVSEPRLSVRCEVENYYPKELSKNLLLPLIVSNREDAASASGYYLHVAPLPEENEEMAFTINGLAVGTQEALPVLRPGDAYQVNFSIDLTDRCIGSDLTSVKVKTVLRNSGGDDVAESTATLNFKPFERAQVAPAFSFGKAVQPSQFIGRDAEVKQMCDAVLGIQPEGTPLVLGIRRMGKTSLLKKVLDDREVKHKFHTVFWDPTSTSSNSAECLQDLAENIRDELPERESLTFSRPMFKENPFVAFDKFVSSLERLKSPKKVLVAIDELDHIAKAVKDTQGRQGKMDKRLMANEAVLPEVLGAIRKVVVHGDRLRFICAALPELLTDIGYKDRLFGSLIPVHLAPFTKEESIEVLEKAERFHVSPIARNRILRATGRQPYLLQVLCSVLFIKRMMHTGRDLVTQFDVEESIEEHILPNASYFTDYVRLAGDATGVLRAVANAERALQVKKRREYVTVDDVHRELRQRGLGMEKPDLARELNRMCDGDPQSRLLERNPSDKNGYQSTIGLLADHLLKESH